ncbi:unnamed protein product [Phytophthora lilii]|uniref:Unnamed protein product n=1 Tax=Phytophthora lilii TaxID=2077276 RepID=A0A9W6YDL9_9STRA|nr:unnamed protein product [Phytophthora lilii]
MTMAKKAHKTGRAVVVREIMSSPETTPVKAAPGKKQTQKQSNDVVKLLKTTEMGSMVAKCWQQMLQAGWETMTQGDGQVLYKMPGTSFFDLVPNVSPFDSLEKACARFLSDWVKSTAIDATDSQEASELTDFVWPMAAGSGWESLSTNSETLYKKADLPFDQWVPNVTIFRSKSQAVAKYLEECGLIGGNDEQSPEKEEIVADDADSDVEMEEAEQSESEDEEQLSQESKNDSEEDNQQESSDEEQEQEKPAPAKKASKKVATKPKTSVQKSKPAKTVSKVPAMPAKKTQKTSKPLLNIPPFKMAFGKVEKELKSRGWYWKSAGLVWNYYQPYCKTKDKTSLKPKEDFFRGREELEDYLTESGLYEHIREKLEEEHNKQYLSESESESEVEEVESDEEVKIVKTAPQRPVKPAPKVQPAKAASQRGRSRAKPVNRFRRARSKSVAPGLSSETTLSEVKFGEIWRILSEDGWHYSPGKLEYDYFKPHCETSKDGEAGVDYFLSKDLLIEHLKRTGLWEATARRVRAEAAMDSSDEELVDSDVETATPVQKRKRTENTPASQHGNKKYKDGSLFRTPTDKRLATADLSDEDEDMEETISPDAAGVKGKEGNHGNGRPLRNLANSFTPSPGASKKEKPFQHLVDAGNNVAVESTRGSSAHKMITNAIQKLTSAYIPENFRHREKEFGEIREFFSDCFLEKKKTSLYISGAPGCGKTALLKATQSDIDELYRIDTLLKKNGIENDLCRLFELSHRASHSFILVGIANQVDFTERHLPMLQQRLPDCSPRVVIFEPYKHPTIERILTDRLGGEAAATKMVSPHGISFLARKIASTTGDIRLAVDTCRRVLQHKLDQSDKENSENPADDKELARPLPLTDMLRIIKHALESKSALVIRSLPRNLQMILFASTRLLIVTANRAANNGSDVTPLLSVNELYTCYCEVSKDAGVFKPLAERDFRTALDTLGEEGLIAEAELRKHLIKLLFSTSELLQSFRKDPFFSRLLMSKSLQHHEGTSLHCGTARKIEAHACPRFSGTSRRHADTWIPSGSLECRVMWAVSALIRAALVVPRARVHHQLRRPTH